MAKRKRSIGGMNVQSERNRVGGMGMAQIAHEFSAAEGEFRRLEAALESKRSSLRALRDAMLSALGGYGEPAAPTRKPASAPKAARGPKPRAPGEGPRAGSLGAIVLQVLSDGTPRKVSDIITAVKKAGYKSKGSAKSQQVMVNQTLIKLTSTGQISKKDRGIYGK